MHVTGCFVKTIGCFTETTIKSCTMIFHNRFSQEKELFEISFNQYEPNAQIEK